MEGMKWLTFVYFANAIREDLLTDEDWQRVELELLRNPQAGAVIAGTGGARKLRVRLTGRGKRGGARTVYVYLVAREKVYFLLTYAKNEQADLSADDKRVVRQLVEHLEAAGR